MSCEKDGEDLFDEEDSELGLQKEEERDELLENGSLLQHEGDTETGGGRTSCEKGGERQRSTSRGT